MNCGVGYQGDVDPEFYRDTACATLVAVGGVLYGPAAIPAGPDSQVPWTPVSQAEGGSGTSGDPYWIKTIVTGGDLELTQLDTYVVGENSYRTSIGVKRTSGDATEAIIYHGADCYLQDSDDGFGSHNSATGAVTCHAPDKNGEFSAEARIEEFVPLSAGSNFLYGRYYEVWDAIETKTALPDDVLDGDVLIDNGIALSWSVNVGAETQSVSMLTNFSPLGLTALTTAVAATEPVIEVGEESTVKVTVQNPNPADQNVTQMTVTLPDNVSYVAGSADTSAQPTVSGQTLTFANLGPVVNEVPFELQFKVLGVNPGVGTITVAGQTESGAPLIGSTGTIEIIDGNVVIPQAPEVVQGSCPIPGSPVNPTVTLPANTDKVVYAMSGEVVAGASVEVTATAQSEYYFPATVAGWTISENRDVATMSVALDENPCEPVTPEIVSLAVDPNPATNVCPATTANTVVSGTVALPVDETVYEVDVAVYKWVGEGQRPAVGEPITDEDWEWVDGVPNIDLDEDGNFSHAFADLVGGEYDVQATLFAAYGEDGYEELDFEIEALTVTVTDCEKPAEEKPSAGKELPKTGASIGLALLLGGAAVGSGVYLHRRGSKA